ncbi:MAG: choice-of-anchor D domain-containing protein [Gracilimonas sp.]
MGFRKTYLIRAIGIIVVALCYSLAYAGDTLKVQSVQSGPNEMVEVQVLISNDTPFTGFQFDLIVPDVLELQDPAGELSERADDHSLSINEVSDNTIRVVVFSVNQLIFTGNSGTVVTLFFESGTIPDTYALELTDAIIADTNQQNTLDQTEDGTYTLLAPDINSSTNDVDFGEVPLDASVSQNVQISNEGNISLNVNDVQSDNPDYSLSGLNAGEVLNAGESASLTISFSPSGAGNSDATITIQSDDPDEPEITIEAQAHTFSVNELHVGSAEGENGEIVTIPVDMNNMDAILGAELKINLPEIADYVEGSVQLTDRKDDHQISANVTGDQLHIISFSSSNAAFSGNDGTLFEFQLELTGQRGSYPLSVEEAILTDASLSNVLSDYSNGEVSLKAPQIVVNNTSIDLGDLAIGATTSSVIEVQNAGSDTLEITDIQETGEQLFFEQINWMVPPGKQVSIPFDLYSDTEGSMSELVRIVHNDQPRNPTDITIQADFFEPNQLNVLNVTNRPGKKDTVWVALDNFTEVVGVQFEITFPLNFVLEDAFLSRRKQDHSLSFASINESSRQYRVLSFSSSGAAYTNATDTLAGFELQTPYSTGSFNVNLAEVVLSDAEGNDVASGFQNGVFTLEFDTLSGRISYWSDETMGVPGATLSITSPDSSFNWTNEEDGSFQNIIPYESSTLGAFRPLQEWDRIAVSVADIVKLHRSIVGLDSPLTGESFFVGNVNADEQIDVRDGYLLEQFILMNIDRFSVGSWSILPSEITSDLPTVTDTTTTLYVPKGDTSNIHFTGFLFGDINGSWTEISSQNKENLIDVDLSEVAINTARKSKTDTRQVTLQGEIPDSVAGWQASIIYDTGQLDLVKISSSTNSLSYSVYKNSDDKGLITLLWYDVQNPKQIDKSSDLVTFHFKNKEGQIDDLVSLHEGYELVGTDSRIVEGSLNLNFGEQTTALLPESELPDKTELIGAYPNPFNPSTTIQYKLDQPGNVRLQVYNILGKHVKTLVNKNQSAGTYNVRFDATNLTSGVYLFLLETSNYQLTKKALYLK